MTNKTRKIVGYLCKLPLILTLCIFTGIIIGAFTYLAVSNFQSFLSCVGQMVMFIVFLFSALLLFTYGEHVRDE